MPITVTFDIERPTPRELNRLRGAFERLGWEHLGNTAYRYPILGRQQSTEDWFNHVVPALMLLRAFARHVARTGRNIVKFSIDVQSSTGMNPNTGVGVSPLAGPAVDFSLPSRSGQAFGLQRLIDWLDGVEWPYA
jgi:hypothetical protein